MSDLERIMTEAGAASKDLRYGESACPHDERAGVESREVATPPRNINDSGEPIRRPMRESRAQDSREASPIPVCSLVNHCGARRAVDGADWRWVCLWMDSA